MAVLVIVFYLPHAGYNAESAILLVVAVATAAGEITRKLGGSAADGPPDDIMG